MEIISNKKIVLSLAWKTVTTWPPLLRRTLHHLCSPRLNPQLANRQTPRPRTAEHHRSLLTWNVDEKKVVLSWIMTSSPSFLYHLSLVLSNRRMYNHPFDVTWGFRISKGPFVRLFDLVWQEIFSLHLLMFPFSFLPFFFFLPTAFPIPGKPEVSFSLHSVRSELEKTKRWNSRPATTLLMLCEKFPFSSFSIAMFCLSVSAFAWTLVVNERPCNGFLCPLFSLAHIRQKPNRVRKVTTYFLFTLYLSVSNKCDFWFRFWFCSVMSYDGAA